jgi:hypothetical protein
VAIRWAGDFDEYLLHPPQVVLPAGVTRERVTAETSSAAGRNLVTYHLALRAAAPGRYALDPVELRYTPRGEAEPVASRIAGPTVEVAAATVAGLSPRALAWGGAGAAAATALGVAGIAFGRRRAARRREASGRAGAAAARHRELTDRFAAARRRRLEGDAAGFLAALAEIEAELDREIDGITPATPAERAALARALEAARFGGRRPPAAELDPHERRVERRLSALRPDPARRERAGIALRDGPPASRIHEPIEEGR